MYIKHNNANGFDGLNTNRLVFMAGGPEGPQDTPDPIQALVDAAPTILDPTALQVEFDNAMADAQAMLAHSADQVPKGPTGDVEIGEVSYVDGANQDRVDSIVADATATIQEGFAAAPAAPKGRVGIENPDGTVDYGRERTPEQERVLADALAQVQDLLGPLSQSVATTLATLGAAPSTPPVSTDIPIDALDSAATRQLADAQKSPLDGLLGKQSS